MDIEEFLTPVIIVSAVNAAIWAIGVAFLKLITHNDMALIRDRLSWIGWVFLAVAISVLVVSPTILLTGKRFFSPGSKLRKTFIIAAFSFTLLLPLYQISSGIGAISRASGDGLVQTTIWAVKKSMPHYGHKDYNSLTTTWDKLQTKHQCCGNVNYTDWWDGMKLPNTPKDGVHTVPDSCCIAQTENCGIGAKVEKIYANTPCHTFMEGKVHHYLMSVGLFGLISLTILLLLTAIVLYWEFKFRPRHDGYVPIQS